MPSVYEGAQTAVWFVAVLNTEICNCLKHSLDVSTYLHTCQSQYVV